MTTTKTDTTDTRWGVSPSQPNRAQTGWAPEQLTIRHVVVIPLVDAADSPINLSGLAAYFAVAGAMLSALPAAEVLDRTEVGELESAWTRAAERVESTLPQSITRADLEMVASLISHSDRAWSALAKRASSPQFEQAATPKGADDEASRPRPPARGKRRSSSPNHDGGESV